VPVTMKITVFWDMTPCSLEDMYRSFRGISWLSHQDGCTLMMKAVGSFETLLHTQDTRSHDVTSKTTVIFNHIFGFSSKFQTRRDNWMYYFLNT
jgi:hypothetical protein